MSFTAETVPRAPQPAPPPLPPEVEAEYRRILDRWPLLSPAEQRVLTLREVDGLRYTAIARRLGLPLPQVEHLLSTGRERLAGREPLLAGASPLPGGALRLRAAWARAHTGPPRAAPSLLGGLREWRVWALAVAWLLVAALYVLPLWVLGRTVAEFAGRAAGGAP